MAGGMHGRRGAGIPLWQRAAAAGAEPPDGAKPCWVEGREGSLLAWRRTPQGWQALVVAWWPAAQVRPRIGAGSPDQREGGPDDEGEGERLHSRDRP
jgi:hypothetical protein